MDLKPADVVIGLDGIHSVNINDLYNSLTDHMDTLRKGTGFSKIPGLVSNNTELVGDTIMTTRVITICVWNNIIKANAYNKHRFNRQHTR
jgi:hypothetical protein